MNKIIEKLQAQNKLWLANEHAILNTSSIISSGYDALDQKLGGGMPDNSVIELQTINGIGELRLLLPYLRAKIIEQKSIVFIAPPAQISSQMLLRQQIPLAQTLIVNSTDSAQSLWSAEQCLKSGCVGGVLLWQNYFSISQVKRLKLAAEQGAASLFILRGQPQLSLSLPVNLCLNLKPHPLGLTIKINKQLGRWPSSAFILDMRQQWPELTQSQPRQPISANVIQLKQRKIV